MKRCLLLILVNFAIVYGHIKTVKGSSYLLAENDTNVLDWWQNAVFYQIYPRSFMDSDNDGVGDLQGIIQRLDHILDMGVSAIWLSPIFKSPQVDQGYDISDYYSIDPDYGTLNDLRQLVQRAHDLDIKIILDFVPNHTSDKHEWFQQSVNNATGEYGDFYIWKDCVKSEDGTVTPPNNWISHFSDSAWEYNNIRNQCYLHQFAIEQPDLNYSNPNVVTAMNDVVTYWLNFGIDGFRMDAVGTLFEDPEFRDEPLSNIPGVKPNDHDYLSHIYTADQPGTYEMIYQWRELLDAFTKANQSDTRVMMTETYTSIEKTMLYYGSDDGARKGAHFAFNFILITDIARGFSVVDLIKSIEKWILNIPDIYTSNWVLGNHDNHRVATRFGVEFIDIMNMLDAFLPGVMVTYNGEEIGMEDGEVTCEQGHDPRAIKNCSTFAQTSRDFERTPFHWDNSTNAGFNKGAEPWLPVSNKSATLNLADQERNKNRTYYSVYKDLLRMKKTFSSLKNFDFISFQQLSENVVQIIRQNSNFDCSLVINVGDAEERVLIGKRYGDYVVTLASVNSPYVKGDVVENGTLVLGAYDSVIVQNTVVSGAPISASIVYSIIFISLGLTVYLF